MTNRDDEKWKKRFNLLRYFAIALLSGVVCFVWQYFLADGFFKNTLIVLGLLFMLPFCVYLFFLTIWHWKQRYIGKHSDLWGALILVETSGWMKIVYLFRHIIPDARGRGRYTVQQSPPTLLE